MKGVLMVFMLLEVFSGNCLLRSQTATMKRPLPSSESQTDERHIIARLQSALSSTQYSVRIYFHGICGGDSESALQFPRIDILPPKENEHGVSAVREMFRNDPNVVVSVDASNIVRIIIGNVYRPIMETKLSSIKLSATARYNPGGPGGAISTIEAAPPVQAAMREHRIRQEPAFYIGLEQPPLRKGLHLVATMSNLSVDQALDAIAKTFPGVVIYGECENGDSGHTVDIKFDWYQAP